MPHQCSVWLTTTTTFLYVYASMNLFVKLCFMFSAANCYFPFIFRDVLLSTTFLQLKSAKHVFVFPLGRAVIFDNTVLWISTHVNVCSYSLRWHSKLQGVVISFVTVVNAVNTVSDIFLSTSIPRVSPLMTLYVLFIVLYFPEMSICVIVFLRGVYLVFSPRCHHWWRYLWRLYLV